MANVSQCAIEIVDSVGQCAVRNGCIDHCRIGHIVRGVFGKSRVKQDLWRLRALLPYQAHVHRLGALHGNQRRDFAALCFVGAGLGLRKERGRADQCDNTARENRLHTDVPPHHAQ
jgi:hypothetical protein